MTPTRQILVTGGSGFIGSHLVERLLEDGNQVTVIDDLSTGSLANLARCIRHPALRFVESKVSECRQLPEIVANSDQIYHLAAAVGVELVVRSPIRTIKTNLQETEAILEAAATKRVPLLLTSTSEVYGKSQKPAFTEEDDLLIGPPTLGRWSYACSKLMDEFLALAYAGEYGLPVTIARLFNTVGPRQTGRYGMVLPRFISAALTGDPLRIHGTGEQTRCFCHVGDTVKALILLAQCPTARGEIFNVGSEQETTIRNLAERVVRLLGSHSPLEFVPYHKAYTPGFEDMMRRRPVVQKLLGYTGFAPTTPLDEIIQLTAKSLQVG